MRCLSCGPTSARASREHVFSDWLLKELECEKLPMNFYRRAGDGSITDHRSGIANSSFKLKEICEDCNNGWMSRLEDSAKPVIVDLIRKQRTLDSLAEEERRILAKWAGKTALVESRAIGAECPVSETILNWMRAHENGWPGKFGVAACSYALGALCHMQVGIILPLLGGQKASGNIVVLGIANLVLSCAFPIPELPHVCKCDLSVYQPLWPPANTWKPMDKEFRPLPERMQPSDALVEFAERIELFQSVEVTRP
jgi:hypothetical protein